MNYQYTIINHEGEEGEIGLFWGYVQVGGGRHKKRRNRLNIWM
jgi:hypothetical protein